MHGALIRYRVMTFIVGSALIVLVFVGVPLQVWGHFELVAKVEGTIHGYLYLVYLFTAADLARRAHWRLGRILAVVLSGFVPFLAFVVEHRVVPADAGRVGRGDAVRPTSVDAGARAHGDGRTEGRLPSTADDARLTRTPVSGPPAAASRAGRRCPCRRRRW